MHVILRFIFSLLLSQSVQAAELSGLQIVPLAEMYPSPTLQAAALKRQQLQLSIGYIEQAAPHVSYLLNLKTHASYQIQKNSGSLNPNDAHLKGSLKEIDLAFPGKGLAVIDTRNILGFSPDGVWDNGWTGFKEFFEDSQLGVCEFSVINRHISKGTVKIAKEIARYDINDLPNYVEVIGDRNSGFLYSVKWFDNVFTYNLICANMNYERNTTENVIRFAKLIAGR